MEESTGAGGFQQELCKDAVVRRTFVLPQEGKGCSYLFFGHMFSGLDCCSSIPLCKLPRIRAALRPQTKFQRCAQRKRCQLTLSSSCR